MESFLLKQMKWSCRRGMKELELVLIPFSKYLCQHMKYSKQLDFIRLLELDDLTLFNCLFNNQSLSDEHLQALVMQIKQFRVKNVAN